VDDAERDLPLGRDGDILVRGPELFIGYTDPALNAQAFTADGWFRTGDIGRLDGAGCLSITDRKKDIVIRGWRKHLVAGGRARAGHHPAVRDVGGSRHARRTLRREGLRFRRGPHRPAAGPGTRAEPLRCCRRRSQKTPEALFILDDLPRTASGKVRKDHLRRQFHA
jgi:non-ribosomal peptide synthetase component E (peptide arylation enzyme)